MGIKLTNGTLIDLTNNKEICKVTDFNDGICTTELSADAFPIHHITTTADLNIELEHLDIESFKSLTTQPVKSFYLEYDIPILIQKRYHKKKRINKKWIKRYGFKKAYIHCQSPTTTVEATPQNDGLYMFDMDIFKLIMTFPKEIKNNEKLLWFESNSI